MAAVTELRRGLDALESRGINSSVSLQWYAPGKSLKQKLFVVLRNVMSLPEMVAFPFSRTVWFWERE